MSQTTHSYYDWQVSTLMLAHDVAEPISRHDVDGLERRQRAAERELYEMAHAVLPEEYRKNPQREFPPEVVVMLTRATLRRAAEIAGILGGNDEKQGGNER